MEPTYDPYGMNCAEPSTISYEQHLQQMRERMEAHRRDLESRPHTYVAMAPLTDYSTFMQSSTTISTREWERLQACASPFSTWYCDKTNSDDIIEQPKQKEVNFMPRKMNKLKEWSISARALRRVIKDRSGEVKVEFIKYMIDHPNERFWQSVRNFSGSSFVLFSTSIDKNIKDTFYMEGKNE